LEIELATLEPEDGTSRDDTQRRQLGKTVDEIFCDAVTEIFGIRIGADVDERQDGRCPF
jgi:hypothetical protein